MASRLNTCAARTFVTALPPHPGSLTQGEGNSFASLSFPAFRVPRRLFQRHTSLFDDPFQRARLEWLVLWNHYGAGAASRDEMGAQGVLPAAETAFAGTCSSKQKAMKRRKAGRNTTGDDWHLVSDTPTGKA
jgi:hypothetical protein